MSRETLSDLCGVIAISLLAIALFSLPSSLPGGMIA